MTIPFDDFLAVGMLNLFKTPFNDDLQHAVTLGTIDTPDPVTLAATWASLAARPTKIRRRGKMAASQVTICFYIVPVLLVTTTAVL